MRRDRLAPLVIVVGLALAGWSATSWLTNPSEPGRSAADGSTASTPRKQGQGTITLPTADKPKRKPANSAATGKPGSSEATRKPGERPPPSRPSGQPVVGRVPTTLQLPSLGVAAAVLPIGDANSGTLIPPDDPTAVGWWAAGSKPGSGTGTSILAGHTVHTGGGALDDLERVQAGDRVVVERPGRDLVYTVDSVTIYGKGELAQRAQEVFRQTGAGRLAVVTCEDWNGEEYLSNVVVIATNPRPLPPA